MSEPSDPNVADTSQPPVAPSAPEPPPAPEPPIGKIVDPAAQTSGLMKQPTSDQLRMFPAPPPIQAPPKAPDLSGQPGATDTLSPPMPMHPLGDNLRGLGITLMADPSGREEKIDEPAPAPQPKMFHELSERTQAELMAGWRHRHPNEPFPDNWVEPVLSSPKGPAELRAAPTPDTVAEVEIERKPVKVTQRTLDEMQAGAARLAQRREETERVRRMLAEQNADKLASASTVPADASNMDYTEGR